MNFSDNIKELRKIDGYADAEKFILTEIKRLKYPSNHPFMKYPSTSEGMTMFNLIFLTMYGLEKEIIADFLGKCKGVENGKFNNDKFRQGINEVIFLQYILFAPLQQEMRFISLLYQNDKIINNNKKPEYSLIYDEENLLINIEVKTLKCDAMPYGKILPDGEMLIMPYYKDTEFISELKTKYPDCIILEDKCCLNQIRHNMTKIKEKFSGENETKYNFFNIGVIFIDGSSSIEQFHAYLFNEKYGIYSRTNFGNIDAIVFISLDAKNDLFLRNIYEMGYVQTYLLKNNPLFINVCRKLRLDNFIGIEDNINEKVLENAKKEYEIMKMFNRDGFLNIIPYEATEEEIDDYLKFLKGDSPNRK